MTWRIDDPQGNEGAKISWEIVQYTRGRGLDLGCGPRKTYAHWISVDNGQDSRLFNHQINPDVRVETAEDLSLFASGSMDFVFSSHLLEHIDYERVPDTLREWMRVIKTGGHMTLYLPDENQYPKIGEPGSNPDHRWNVSLHRVVDAMPNGFDLIDYQVRSEGNEYSLYIVFKKTGNGRGQSWLKDKPTKTCGVVRYGAFGDLLQSSSVFAGLKKQGYHVTLYTSPPGDQVVRHDPNIDAFYLQDKDQVPNQCLGDFWAYHSKKYDKWVNLSESVEGTLLALPGRTHHSLPPALRHEMMNRNYVEFQHAIAGVPHDPVIKFHATEQERIWAKREKKSMGFPLIMWSLSGSSVHKSYHGLDRCIAATLLDFPTAHFVLVGGPEGKILEAGWEKEPRVHLKCGEYKIRESMALAQVADCVIGPETGILNCVANEPMPKMIFLSHSTVENLTRDWVNTHSVVSEHTVCPGRGNNEAPSCHQLHFGWQHCKRTESGVSQCMEDIPVEKAYRVLWHCIQSVAETKAA